MIDLTEELRNEYNRRNARRYSGNLKIHKFGDRTGFCVDGPDWLFSEVGASLRSGSRETYPIRSGYELMLGKYITPPVEAQKRTDGFSVIHVDEASLELWIDAMTKLIEDVSDASKGWCDKLRSMHQDLTHYTHSDVFNAANAVRNKLTDDATAAFCTRLVEHYNARLSGSAG